MLRRFRSLWIACLSTALIFAATAGSGGNASLIRDPDIERGLRELATPILNAAGLSPARVRIFIVNDSSLNAFVIDASTVFVHSGLVMKLKSAAELQSVIAHEVAHIANGHITRRMVNSRTARTAAGLGLALSIAAGAATGESDLAAGIALGTSSVAGNVFLSHTRAEEASADQAALRYMASAGIDPGAMNDVLDIFRGQEALSAPRQDPYVRGHPLTRDRIRAVKGFAAAYKSQTRAAPEAEYWFARLNGKLSAFLRNPAWTLRRVKKTDTSDVAMMRRAIALHRSSKSDQATREIAALVGKRPRDPYLRELQGQILLESGRTKSAVAAYASAVELAPNEPLIRAGYGRALLALNTAQANGKALDILESARSRDPRDARLMRDLALAYSRAGQNGMASLATAERYAIQGNLETAGIHATRASGLLPRGSAGWRRAQDVLSAVNAAKRRKRG